MEKIRIQKNNVARAPRFVPPPWRWLRNLRPNSRHLTHLFVLSLTAAMTVASGVPNLFSRPPQPTATIETPSIGAPTVPLGSPRVDVLLSTEGDTLSVSSDVLGPSLALPMAEQAPLPSALASTGFDPESPPDLELNSSRAHASARGGVRPREDALEAIIASDTLPEPDSTGETAPQQPQPRRPFTYQVVAGDTLSGLAQRFEVSPETILWANGLPGGGDILQVGQSLTILPLSGVLHTVRSGDNLLAIALMHEVEPQAIVEANGLADPSMLAVDQQLVLPGGRKLTPAAPPPLEHLVQRGDTVRDIALWHAVEPAAIVRANSLLDPNLLTPGSRLVVPGGQLQPATTATRPVTTLPDAQAGQSQPVAPAPAASGPGAETQADRNRGEGIVALAMQYEGYRYRWGGHLPSTGFDCSGFTWYVYLEAGINIPQHDLWGQIAAGRQVSRDELLPGDLVFFQNTYRPGLSHSGVYMGGGRFINAVAEGVGVQVRSLSEPYWASRWFAASRPW